MRGRLEEEGTLLLTREGTPLLGLCGTTSIRDLLLFTSGVRDMVLSRAQKEAWV